MDLRKHRQDVFRLFPLISNDMLIPAPAEVYRDIQLFINAVQSLPFETNQIGITVSKEDILGIYSRIYVPQ